MGGKENEHSCENKCTKMTSCVGYSYGRLCYLYPSYKRQCPPRWREERYGHVALTGNDLVHEGVGGARYCKVKQGTLQRISGEVYIRMLYGLQIYLHCTLLSYQKK